MGHPVCEIIRPSPNKYVQVIQPIQMDRQTDNAPRVIQVPPFLNNNLKRSVFFSMEYSYAEERKSSLVKEQAFRLWDSMF